MQELQTPLPSYISMATRAAQPCVALSNNINVILARESKIKHVFFLNVLFHIYERSRTDYYPATLISKGLWDRPVLTCPLSRALSCPLFLSFYLSLYSLFNSLSRSTVTLKRQIPSTLRLFLNGGSKRAFQTTFCSHSSRVRQNFDSSAAFGQSLFLLALFLQKKFAGAWTSLGVFFF